MANVLLTMSSCLDQPGEFGLEQPPNLFVGPLPAMGGPPSAFPAEFGFACSDLRRLDRHRPRDVPTMSLVCPR